MYADLYKNHNHVEISAMQIFTAALIVMVTLVIPASYIHFNAGGSQEQTPYTAEALREREAEQLSVSGETGRVAGINSLESVGSGVPQTIRIPFTSIFVNIDSQEGLLTIGGSALVLIGICLVLYLLLSDSPQAQAEFNINQDFESQSLNRWN